MLEPWDWVPVCVTMYVAVVLTLTNAPVNAIARAVVARVSPQAHWTERARRIHPWRLASLLGALGSIVSALAFMGHEAAVGDPWVMTFVAALPTLVAVRALGRRSTRAGSMSWRRAVHRAVLAATLGRSRFWALPLTIAAGATFEPRVALVVDAIVVLALALWSLATPTIAPRAEEPAVPSWTKAVEAARARLGRSSARAGVLDLGSASVVSWPRDYVTAPPEFLAVAGDDPLALEGAALLGLTVSRRTLAHQVPVLAVVVGLAFIGADSELAAVFDMAPQLATFAGVLVVYLTFTLSVLRIARARRACRAIAPGRRRDTSCA